MTTGAGRPAPQPGAASPRPLLVTMGDAAGIGPEIIVAAFRRGALDGCVVVGDAGVMRRAGAAMTAVIASPADLPAVPPGCLPVWCPPALQAAARTAGGSAVDSDTSAGDDGAASITGGAAAPALATLPWGHVDARCGAAAAHCIEAAVGAVQAGQGAAIVTAPIHKEALAAAGVPYPGHTEMLQALATRPGAEPPPVRMMLANDELRVVLVTIHMALRRAIDAVTYDAVLQTLRIAHAAAAGWGIARPRIAVAGLNPHAGEGGLFGDEELTVIAPAVRAACAEGIDAQGPFPPDTVFMRARAGAGRPPPPFDLVVAMTHDHGLIPVKYLGVEHGVNVTLGLPFVRTSPDHGTAFDIAGRGVADPSSLMAAVAWARRWTTTDAPTG